MARKKEISRHIFNQNKIDKLNIKIKKLGIYNQIEATKFMNLRLFSTIIIFFVIPIYI